MICSEKERERMLLRGAIKKQGTEINKLKQENEQLKSKRKDRRIRKRNL